MGRLTTHVLDTARGQPAAGIVVTLFRLDGERRELTRSVTNPDGITTLASNVGSAVSVLDSSVVKLNSQITQIDNGELGLGAWAAEGKSLTTHELPDR